MHRVRQLTRPYLRILIILGSFAQCLLPHIRKLFPGVIKVLVIDNPEEQSRIQDRHLSPAVKLFPMGLGHTAVTLSAGRGMAIEAFSRSTAGMNAKDGAAQSPCFGRAGVVDLVENSNLIDYMDVSLPDELAIAANGPLLGIQIDYVGSENGGTCAGGVLELDSHLAPALRNATGAIITSHFWLAGEKVHRGLGPRIGMNASTTSVRVIDYLTDPTANGHHVRAATFFDLQGCKRDDARRSQRLCTAMQAANGASLMADMNRVAPNNAGNGPLGNIGLWEFGFGEFLDPVAEVASALSHQYLPALEALQKEAVDPHAIAHLELVHREYPQQQRNIDDVVADADIIPAEQLIQELITPSCQRIVSVVAHVNDTLQCDVEAMIERWHRPQQSLSDFRERRQEQLRLNELLSALEAELVPKLEHLVEEEEHLSQRVAAMHQLLDAKGLNYFKAAVTSNHSKRNKLRRLAIRLRHVAEDRYLAESELSAVTPAIARVGEVRQQTHKNLGGLIANLKGYAVRSAASTAYVAGESLDDTFVSLWQAAQDDAVLLETLTASVARLTLDGLAKVTGSPTRDLSAIASQIVHGGCYTTAPIPWGNLPRLDEGLVVHVLPPLDGELADQLSEACRTLDPHVNLHFGETCAAGVGVVAIVLRDAEHVKQIITPTMQAALGKALRAPHPVQFLMDDLSILDRVGIAFDGTKISFTR